MGRLVQIAVLAHSHCTPATHSVRRPTVELLSRVAPTSRARLNVLADAAAIVVASLLCSVPPDATFSPGWGRVHWASALFAMVFGLIVWGVGAYGLRHYDPWKAQGVLGELALTTVLVAGTASALFLVRRVLPLHDGELHLTQFVLIVWPVALVVRMLGLAATAIVHPKRDPVLVLGTGSLGLATGEYLQSLPSRELLGFIRLPSEAPARRSLPGVVLGFADDLEHVLMHTYVTEVWISGSAMRDGDAIQQAIRCCEKFGIPFALPACNFRLGRSQPAEGRAFSDGFIHYQSFQPKPVQMAMKRLLDIAASTVALVVLAPLLVVVALGIKATSKGPVFFKQQRVGMHGRLFHMLKFRSMVTDAERLKKALMAKNEQTGPVFKMARDPRVTDIGRFLRKYSIDELPQLVNVLRGDMALVGPRPPVPSEVAKYEPWQRRRLSVRPGLTCVWQVSGRNQISFEEWMYLDMQYIDNWSLREDLSLIFRTVPVVLTGRGAS